MLHSKFVSPAQAMALLCGLALALGSPARADFNIKLLGQLSPFPGDNRYADLWGDGHYAYLGSFNGSGVMIINLATPSAPFLAAHYNPPSGGRFLDVVVANGIGYFGSGNGGGVHLVNLSDPANPTLITQITAAQNGYASIHEIFVADGFLFEADSRTSVVKVFDVRNPASPSFVRDILATDPRFIHNLTVVNHRMYTSGWGGKTDIWDVSNIDTRAPILLGSVDSGSNSHSNWVSSDGRLLASAREIEDGDVRIYDLSDPAHPALLSTITAGRLGIRATTPHNPFILGQLLFASWYQAGLQVLDLSDPAHPVHVGSYDTFPGPVSGFDGNWGVYPFLGLERVLLSDLDSGLLIVDASAVRTAPITVSAASYSRGAITSKAIVAAFGPDLTAATQAATTIPLPTSLAGTTIKVTDSAGAERLAPLFYASPTQINYQIPEGTTVGPAMVTVTDGEGRRSIGTVQITAVAPSLFTRDQSGTGPAAAIDAITYAGPPFAATQANGQPNIVALYGTGLGAEATDVDGDVSASVQVVIGGRLGRVQYAGRAPGFVGLNQLNVELPAGISAGTHPLAVSRQGVASNLVTIAIK